MPTKKKTTSKSAKKPAAIMNIVPVWKKSPPALIDIFASTMKLFPGMEVRKVFGYPCGFVNGNMATGLHADSMFVRLDAANESELLKVKGAAPFMPMPGRAMRGYVVLPRSLHNRQAELNVWIERALKHTATLPPKVKK